MEITIRPLTTVDECEACERLQARVWAMSDQREVVPLHLLLAVQRNGGLLLGAFAGGELVGFVFGFAGRSDAGVWKHCSHMLGVDPELRDSGIGYRLKLAQRRFAQGQGFDLVTWTYDPLESRNAYFNICKLGAVCRAYLPDYYGQMANGLNAGLPSDRLEVEWAIGSKRVRQRLSGKATPWVLDTVTRVNITGSTASGLLMPGQLILEAAAPAVYVEIPSDYQAIKAADARLALDWRLAVREMFEAHFQAGYVAVDFLSRQADGRRRSGYILQN